MGEGFVAGREAKCRGAKQRETERETDSERETTKRDE